jgi:urease accessory protein
MPADVFQAETANFLQRVTPHHARMPPNEAFTANGSITLSKSGRFSQLEYSFPLKLMAPRLHSPCPHLGVCYVLSFGGGLVSGDAVLLEVRVEAECTLLMLTQVRL